MRKNRLIYFALLLLPGFIGCANDHSADGKIDAGDGQVRLQAAVAKNNILTRDAAPEPAEDGDYYLYYTAVGGTSLSANRFTLSGAGWTAYPALYWDDIKEASTDREDTEFYLTNMDAMAFSPKAVNKDILFGKAKGWKKELDFTLNHLTSKITVIVYDNTLNRNEPDKGVNFSNAKVVFNPGLNQTATGIDYAAGKIKSLDADREKTTTITRLGFSDRNNITIASGTYNGVESGPLHIVPQIFNSVDSLEITAGTYVYRIPVPIPEAKSYPFGLGAGEHLTIYVELSEDPVVATATLTEWEAKNAGIIEVSRVFNIASWNELRDLAQAIATGYTFKGMVVRLTEDIDLQDQISLGTEEYPFEGIFGGNGHKIRNLGFQGSGMRRNKGGLFAYTKGATIQNLILVSPYVDSDGENPVGALIDNAMNTTVFNCRTESVDSYSGEVDGGTSDKVGGLIGTATGTSALINCYSYLRVEGTGEFIGGLIGYSEASITHCFAKGEIDCASAVHVGGLAGYMAGSMQYCYAQGKVTGSSKVGGLIGHLDGKVSQCYSAGQVSGSEAGGLFGCLGFDAEVGSSFWNSWNSKGSGSANLPESCKSYEYGTMLLNTDFLDNTKSMWSMVDGYPEFTNL